MGDDYETASIGELRNAVAALREQALGLESCVTEEIEAVDPAHRASAANLAHYLAVRQRDIRSLQRALSRQGLSSLGFLEGHVVSSLNAVLDVLGRLEGATPEPPPVADVTIETCEATVVRNAEALLGPAPSDRVVRIMVTMPTLAATDPHFIESLLAQGMNIMRINCAHDGPDAWAAMIGHLRRAEEKLARGCRVAFDLGGPKLRTGAIEPGPDVVRFKPARDALGRVVTPARVRLVSGSIIDGFELPTLPVDQELLDTARPGDVVRFTDARGRRREFRVTMLTESGCYCKADQTGYVTSDTPLSLVRDGSCLCRGRIGRLPASEQALLLAVGDSLVVTSDVLPGRPAVFDDADGLVEPARIGCTMPEVFGAVRPGQRVLFDDGKFEGMIRDVRPDQFHVELYRAGAGIARLKSEKGINLPDTDLRLSALTPQDVVDLEFVVQHADLVSLSFVHRPEDVMQLHDELERLGADRTGIVLKIENEQAFQQLPQLLMTALRRPPVAVMVARGDLGVEVGFERLAEVQEEILWLCGAAHVPVIWATQVLESLAKQGMPSRGEVTDAAMSGQAECVMLNKGPYIAEAVRFLDDVLRRMSQHRAKRLATLRRLKVASAYREPGPLGVASASPRPRSTIA